MSSSFISLACCSTGKASSTSLWFEINLCKLKPPFLERVLVFSIRLMACSTDGTDFRPLST